MRFEIQRLPIQKPDKPVVGDMVANPERTKVEAWAGPELGWRVVYQAKAS